MGGESTTTVCFEDDEQRVQAQREWLARREEWKVAEQPARRAEEAYQRLYALYGEIERESEAVRLMLGDGMLRAEDSAGQVEHPVLLQPRKN